MIHFLFCHLMYPLGSLCVIDLLHSPTPAVLSDSQSSFLDDLVSPGLTSPCFVPTLGVALHLFRLHSDFLTPAIPYIPTVPLKDPPSLDTDIFKPKDDESFHALVNETDELKLKRKLKNVRDFASLVSHQ